MKRVNLMLDPDVYQRVRKAVDKLPGVTVSEVVRDCLEESVGYLEALAEAVDSGDMTAGRAALAKQFGDAFVRMALGEEEEDT